MFSNRRETGAKAKPDSQLSGTRPVWRKLVVGFGLLPLPILATTYAQQGFIAAGRAATSMAMPTGIAWLALWVLTIHAFSVGKMRTAACCFLLFLAWTLSGTPFTTDSAIKLVEYPLEESPHPAFEKHTPASTPFDAVVTLGGSASLILDDFAEINDDGERIVSAAQAYHARATRTLITTGTSTDGMGNPSEVSRELLISLGVPPEVIFSIDGANTKAEMKSLAEFLDSPPSGWLDIVGRDASPEIGLITSAFHIPRAMRLASGQGLALTPLPCAFRTSKTSKPWLASDLIPNADNQLKLGIAMKEILAALLGR